MQSRDFTLELRLLSGLSSLTLSRSKNLNNGWFQRKFPKVMVTEMWLGSLGPFFRMVIVAVPDSTDDTYITAPYETTSHPQGW